MQEAIESNTPSFSVIYYVFDKPHRDVDSEVSSLKLTSIELFNKYSDNEKKSDNTYLNKVVEVIGRVSKIVKD